MSVSVTTPGLEARSKTVASVADEHADWGDKEGRLGEPVVDALYREGRRDVSAAIDTWRRVAGSPLLEELAAILEDRFLIDAQRAFTLGENIVPSKEPVVSPGSVLRSTKRFSLKCPVAPLNRPVPPDMTAVSSTKKTPGVAVGLPTPVKSAVNLSPLAAVNAIDPIAVIVTEFTMCGITTVKRPRWEAWPVAFVRTAKKV